MNKDEQAFAALLQEWLRANRPENTRVTGEIYGPGCVEVQFSCDGAIHDMAWNCDREVGHTGKCWSLNKNVEFEREN